MIDQSIRLLRSIRDCYDIGTSEKEELDSLAAAFADVLSSLIHHFTIKPLTPTTVAENCFAPGKEEKETPGRPRFDIPADCENWDSVGLRLEKCWVFRGGRFIGE